MPCAEANKSPSWKRRANQMRPTTKQGYLPKLNLTPYINRRTCGYKLAMEFITLPTEILINIVKQLCPHCRGEPLYDGSEM